MKILTQKMQKGLYVEFLFTHGDDTISVLFNK